MSNGLDNIAIFASGNGTNAINILDYVSQFLENTSVNCLLTDREDAGILSKLRDHAIYRDLPVVIVPFIRHENESYLNAKQRHEALILDELKKHDISWIALAGYMRILSGDFLKKYYDSNLQRNKVINIHPSLLPKYPGKDAYQQAFNSNDKISGVTVHFVDSGIDTGEIILQQSFNRHRDDTFEDFQKRGLQIEYKTYREALLQLNQHLKINKEGVLSYDCL